MSATCERHRDQLIAHVRGELSPLNRAHVQAHLDRCPRCARLGRRLHQGLDAARQWSPPLERGRTEHLLQRLGPYLDSRRSWWRIEPLWIGLAGAAVSLLLVASMTVWWLGRQAESLTPRSAGLVPIDPGPAEPVLDPGVLRSTPTRFLRLVTRADWQGSVEQHGGRVEVRLERGFVVGAMLGGPGRRLRVTTRAASVEVVGTRFFVAVGARGVTTVGVAEGEVLVFTPRHRIRLEAGQTQSVGAAGDSVTADGPFAAALYLEDPFLLELRADGLLLGQGEAGRDVPPHEILRQLERAEQLALAGQVKTALGIYEGCAANESASYEPFRDLCRFERARLVGFARRDTARSRQLLGELVDSAQGEVRRQAVLALCELDLRADPCAAIACLERVMREHARDPDLRREARRLRTRWSPAARYCINPDDGELP